MTNYVSWKVGRNFTPCWHIARLPHGPLLWCGARIPEKALVNWAHLVGEAEVCKVCRERAEQPRAA